MLLPRFLSLDEMITILAADLVKIWPSLQELHLGFSLGGDHIPSNSEVHQTLGELKRFSQSVGWKDLANQTTRLAMKAASGERGEVMEALARDLQDAFAEKTRDITIAIVMERDFALLSNATAHLCGGSLHADMAICEEEFNLAGKAIALGLSTAAVSHAMRGVEAGLQSLATSLGVTFPAPINLQDWLVLTQKITSEISKLEAQPRSQHKTEQLKKLAELIIPADAFRLAWRNHVAHAREKYEDDEARRIMGHVGEYLRKLSEGL